MNKWIIGLGLLLVVAGAVNPPSPVCRKAPLPTTIPVSVGETVRFDLEDIFDGKLS